MDKLVQDRTQKRQSSNVQHLLANLKECIKSQNLEKGKRLHAEALEFGHGSSTIIANALINMYSKCGRMLDAQKVFDTMRQPTVVSWTMLILGYAENGKGLTALVFFVRMRTEGHTPDSVTLVAGLRACTSLAGKEVKCIDWGKEIHNLAVDNDCYSGIYVQNTLIDMYAKCGSMSDAYLVFISMKHYNVVSWTALILGYAENGQGIIALDMFAKMKCEGPAPNFVTFVAVLKACTSLALKGWGECKDRGKEIYNLAMEAGCGSYMYLQNTSIEMFAKCGSMVEARQVFENIKHPDVVSWTALILGYAENGQGHNGLDMFAKMKTRGHVPNSVTFVAALKACSSLAVNEGIKGWSECRERGSKVHNLAMENGYDSVSYVQNTLIGMYAKCGSMLEARWIFNSAKNPDAFSWTALILGYAECGEGSMALDLYTRMRTEGPAADYVTFVAALKACALLGALESGRKIHSEIDNSDFNIVLVTCLVDFYAKCSSLVEAQSVFDLHKETRDTLTWTALLTGFSSCGDYESVFHIFERMQECGFQPDSVTLLSVLTCCSHAGLVDKGKECFDEMSTKYGIVPSVDHYNCMLDIFGRSNKFDEVMALLQHMCPSPDVVTWITVLGACRKWKNIEIGRLAFQSLMNLDVRNKAGYVLMGQIYGTRGMLQEQQLVIGMKMNI